MPSRADVGLPAAADAAVKANALAFLRDAIGAAVAARRAALPDGVRLGPARGPHRRDRSAAVRQPVLAGERRSLRALRPVAARDGAYRLGADESGYENLFFAGDWTRCGLNSGCVEAAVISGLLAAAAVDRTRATHPRRPVAGYRDNEGARYAF